MYSHILIPTDGSTLSDNAVREGVKLAAALGAKVTGFIATPDFHATGVEPGLIADTREEFEDRMQTLAQQALGAVKRAAADAGVRCVTEHVIGERPWEAIIQAARRNRCDLILMASHGRKGVAGLLLGSETNKVLTHSKIPVLVCR